MAKFIKKYYFIFIPLIITGICAAFGLIRYIINDDIAMLKIAESFRTNAHSEHLVFISVIFGYILKFLYKLIPAFNWFIALYLAVLNVAFIALNGIVKKLSKNVLGYSVIGYSIVCAVQVFVISNLTFTSISFISCAAGMLWLTVFVKKVDKKSIKHLIFGFVLLLFAFCMRRNDTFYFIILLFIPIYIFSVLKKKVQPTAVLLTILLCVAANYSVDGIQNLYNRTIPSDVYFTEFRKYRGSANDGGLFNYERHSEELQNAGLTENDYYLLRRWIFADKKVYSADAMKAVAQSRDFDEKYNVNILDILKSVFSQKTALLLLLSLLLLTIISFIIDKQSALETFFILLFTLGGFGFLYFRRRGVERVTSMVLICGILIMCCRLLESLKNSGNLKLSALFNKKSFKSAISLLCIFGIAGTAGWCIRENRRFDDSAAKFAPVAEYVNSDSKDFYISDVRVSSDYVVKYNNDNIFKPYANDDLKFCSFLGSWTIYTYYYYDNLKNLGLEDYSDKLITVLLKDDVRFVTKKMPPKKICRFFKENYGLNVKYKTVKKFKEGKYKVYKFSVYE